MEKVKDVIDNLRERFTNPLVFSFVCSWLVVNWQITIGLLWYDPKEIEKTGCASIFDFIQDKINVWGSLGQPLIFALCYTILMPLIKNFVRAFNTWVSKWGENWNIKISKGGKVPIEKYLGFREEYDKRTKILETTISKEGESLTELNKVKTELIQAKSNEVDLRKKLTDNETFVQQLQDNRMLNGYWICKYSDTVDKKLKGREEAFIQDGKYFIVSDFGNKEHIFNITNFMFDSRTKRIFFVKERIAMKQAYTQVAAGPILVKFNPNELRIERESTLVGIENGTTNIEYTRKDQA